MQDRQPYNILYSCTAEPKRGHEPFVEDHALSYIVSGEMHYHTSNGMIVFPKGSLGFVRRNQLVRPVKLPDADKPFISINILFMQDTLQLYSRKNDVKATGVYTDDSIIHLPGDPFLKGYFDSLSPYFEEPAQMTEALATIKTAEAIELLLRNPLMKNALFDFNEPFKIDLEAFMNRNFVYNVPLVQFARLTGRSLSTFRRDFIKVFSIPPEKWLQKRRLEQAHFLITKRKQRPSDVYLEVRFENLSHFSTSFKEFFGYSPSSISPKNNSFT